MSPPPQGAGRASSEVSAGSLPRAASPSASYAAFRCSSEASGSPENHSPSLFIYWNV